MRRFRRKGHHPARIEELSPDHFTFRKTAYHGFPNGPTAISYEPNLQLLAIATKNGEFRIYGRPGVEFHASNGSDTPIRQIYTFGSLHQYITVDDANVITLWEILMEGQPTLIASRKFKLDPEGGKVITSCCLSQHSGHFYIGTEGGNVFILDVKQFILDSEVIYWNNATALVQPAARSHPGIVKCLALCPTDHNKLLIGYEKGVIVLWNLDRGFPTKNFPATVQDCQQPLESISWQNDGHKFVSAHSDSSLYFWGATNSSAHEGPTLYYGDSGCMPVKKVIWLNTDANPLLIFSGGLPAEEEDEHNTVTVIQGADHVALDFSSPVVDFVAITDPGSNRGKAVIVLCEQEILAFDLEAPKCPQIRKPYLFSLHASPVTCLKLYENCAPQLYEGLHEFSITSPPPHEHFSMMEWPSMGGYVRASEPTAFDILLTGHENGMVKFWDVTAGGMRLIYELKTANLFMGQEPDTLMDDFADFKWPPYRKVSSYDPFEDDPRLAIKFIDFCSVSRTLCVGGNGGQVITFSLNPLPNDIQLECARADIFVGDVSNRRSGRLRNVSPLECKKDLISLPAGFQANFCLQCMPATSITAVAFQPSWGLVAAGNTKGFAVANFLVKRIVLIHPTVQADGIEARSLGRMQSLRRSLRSSLRRRRTLGSGDDRKKVAATLNLEAGIKSPQKQKQFRQRASSEPASSTLEAATVAPGDSQAPPDMAGYITHITFAETHVSGGGASASVFACTMGSVMIRYSLTLPHPSERLVQINRAFIAGKEYALLHAAPIVAVFNLDHNGIPIPNPYEVDNRSAPAPDMHYPHMVIICTQEQIKIVTLPGMRQRRKEKITDLMHERVIKAWIVRVKVAAAPVGAPRDWNPALAVLTNVGKLLVYSLPELRLCFLQEEFVPSLNQRALQSATVSLNGEVFYLRSFSELERSLICSYAFSYHTTMLPSLFPYEGSTQPVFIPSRSSNRQVEVSVELAPEVTTPPKASSPLSDGLQQLDGLEQRARRSRTPSPENSDTGPNAFMVDGTDGPTKEKGSKRPSQSDVVVFPRTNSATNGVMEHAQQYLDTVATSEIDGEKTDKAKKHKSPPTSAADKDLIASAAAFTQMQKQRRRSASSSSTSSSSGSSGSESSDDDLPTPANPQDTTFGNPFALRLEDLGDGNKDLDNIIASSLQQLESARAFYEQMQARVKRSE